MADAASRFPRLTGPLAAEDYVFRLLMHRAESKLHLTDVAYLLDSASEQLKQAGKWTDDVRIQVGLKRPFRAKNCVRMLHGIPSPRLWAAKAPSFPVSPAKDVIYFFAPEVGKRRELLGGAIPHLTSADDLANWLRTFSSTRFEKQLVDALVGHADDNTLHKFALIGAEIDRLAWFTGQRSMTLANSAPVWHP